ncbi:hypothetical protein BDV29DRAFT_64488 [Aspergillus leporis]|uniref:Uncharacterized protein n=1 Tax=Aspergillus leporis TaxID=41062 RepID=A0A5N5XAW9_9EURO|nr:hypothetical protein BDV29DRAFT_64488 [Aspergillus leporis]
MTSAPLHSGLKEVSGQLAAIVIADQGRKKKRRVHQDFPGHTPPRSQFTKRRLSINLSNYLEADPLKLTMYEQWFFFSIFSFSFLFYFSFDLHDKDTPVIPSASEVTSNSAFTSNKWVLVCTPSPCGPSPETWGPSGKPASTNQKILHGHSLDRQIRPCSRPVFSEVCRPYRQNYIGC